MNRVPIIGVGTIVWRAGEVLLIRRANPPFEGAWSLPGGRQLWGESVREAALRELFEETSVEADLLGLVDVVDACLPDGRGGLAHHFTLIDFAARWRAGEPRPGDDASEARFVDPATFEGLGLWAETLRVIEASRRFL